MYELAQAELKTWAKIGAKRIMPSALMDLARARLRKFQRKPVVRAAIHARAGMSYEMLVRGLSATGIAPGADLFVHSALSQLGQVDGGAKTVIAALREVVGTGTLLMPSYPMGASMLAWMASDTTFDVTSSPSRMGGLTEAFRLTPGVVRSAHPTHAVAALGANAAAYTAGHHAAGTPCGPGSPFAQLQARGGTVLCLGSAIGKVTQYHAIEDEPAIFPVAVYLPQPMRKLVRFADGQSANVTTRVHDPRLAPWRIDNFAPKQAEFAGYLREYDAARTARVGQGVVNLIDAPKLQDMMRDLLARGITIYHRPMWFGARPRI